jgi:hypothetical protein
MIGRLDPDGALADTVMMAEMVVEDLTQTFENVTPLGPASLTTVANPVPVRVTFVTLLGATVDGSTAVRVGAATTAKHVEQELLTPLGFVTVTV